MDLNLDDCLQIAKILIIIFTAILIIKLIAYFWNWFYTKPTKPRAVASLAQEILNGKKIAN